MIDPNIDAQRDRNEAEAIRWKERREPNTEARNNLERAAQVYDAEASDIESEVAADEATSEENPE